MCKHLCSRVLSTLGMPHESWTQSYGGGSFQFLLVCFRQTSGLLSKASVLLKHFCSEQRDCCSDLTLFLVSKQCFFPLNLCIYRLQVENMIDSAVSSPITLYAQPHCIHHSTRHIFLPIKVTMVTSAPLLSCTSQPPFEKRIQCFRFAHWVKGQSFLLRKGMKLGFRVRYT